MWNETIAGRGSCEIACCLWNMFKMLPTTMDKITLYSDSCTGQNRNCFVAAMMLAAVTIFPVSQIDHKFLESGHTQMEVDNMHSCIERNSKSVDVFLSRDWEVNASAACKESKPYNVMSLNQDDVMNCKYVTQKLITNKNKADDGSICNWKQVKWIRYSNNNKKKYN